MAYKQIQIPDFLTDCVQSFWKVEDHTNGASLKSFRIIADGCPGIVFQHADKGMFYRDGKQLPVIFLYGPATRHNTLYLSGQFSTIGIFFYPNALKTVFGLDASELTDTCIDLDMLAVAKGIQLSERLLNSASTEEQVEALSSFLFSLKQHHEQRLDNNVQFALSKILLSEGSIPLKELTQSLKLSERTIERKFKEHVGVSPKLFSRICQFQASLRQLKHSNYGKLSDIAFENNFADQSHFIRTFKEFAGFSPNQYIRQSYEVVDNLSEVIS